MSEIMTKEQFLEERLFSDLTNLNDGFDAEGIKYFSQSEFEVVLQRVEANRIEIYGIEPWKDGEYYGIKIAEDYYLDPSDPKWFRKAFEEFKEDDPDLQYAASYGIPERLLKETT